jgi:glycine/D-amino acid oxidase-like deaminating enzyme
MMPLHGGRGDDLPSRGAAIGRYPAGDPPGDGDVRPRRRHVADERLDLGGGARQPKDVQAEIIRINTDARPLALQVALIVPLLAGLIGLFNGFRMMRLPDPEASGSVEGMSFG